MAKSKNVLQMRQEIYLAFVESRAFPKRKCLHETVNFSNSMFGDFREGRPVSEEFAEGFVAYLATNVGSIPKSIANLPVELNSYFRSPYEFYVEFEHPDHGNDPWFRKGLIPGIESSLALVGAMATNALFSPDPKLRIDNSDRALLDPDYDFPVVEQLLHIAVGFAMSSKGEKLTLQEAEDRAREKIREPRGHLASQFEKLFEINPNFIRYVLTGSEKLGVHCMFPITDAAYEATVRGERPMYSYSEEEILGKGNNLVVFAAGEIFNRNTTFTAIVRRMLMAASMFDQAASLLDMDKALPVIIRMVSYELDPANAKRLKAMGFRTCGSGVGPGGYEHKVCVWDPMEQDATKRPQFNFFSTFILATRQHQDESCR
jgi:hypothetical protein